MADLDELDDDADLPVREMRFLIDHPGCPKSMGGFLPTDEGFNGFFQEGATWTCECGRGLFELFISRLIDWTHFGGVTEVLGGVFRDKALVLRPGKSVVVCLDRMGIPEGAEILDISLQGGEPAARSRPAITFEKMAHWDPIPRTFSVQSVPVEDAELHECGEIFPRLCVRYVAPGPDELSVRYLCDAGRHFAAGRYSLMVVSANIAVEAALEPVMRAWMQLTCSEAEVDKLMGRDGISYARQITLTKMASKTLGIVDMPGNLRGLLHKLRDQRNSIVHSGVPTEKKGPLNKERAAELLAAAAFGYQYARYFGTEVARRSTAGKVVEAAR